MTFRPASVLTLALAAWYLMGGAAQAQPTMNAPVIVGANVTFSWSASPGATSYDIQAGVGSGAYSFTLPVGNVTTTAVTAPAVGTYFARVVAQPGNIASNEVIVVVTSLVALPATPTNFQAFRNGTGVLLGWAPGAGGGAASGYRLRVGTSPGGNELGTLTTAVPQLAAGGVPAQTYYLGVTAFNAGGSSAETTEVVLVMPAGGACDTPPTPTVSGSTWGPFLTLNWSAVPGAVSYSMAYSGPYAGQLAFGGNTTQFIYSPLPAGTWTMGVAANFSCGSTGTPGQTTFVAPDDSTLRLQPRAPDPATAVPSYASSVISDMGRRYSSDLRNSCGNIRWVLRVVQELRTRDKRWGLNWKRARVGDASQDVITYNWGDGPDEGSYQHSRAWDIISGHCGSNPSAQFSEITNPQPPGVGTNAIWTLIPYIQAGYTP